MCKIYPHPLFNVDHSFRHYGHFVSGQHCGGRRGDVLPGVGILTNSPKTFKCLISFATDCRYTHRPCCAVINYCSGKERRGVNFECSLLQLIRAASQNPVFRQVSLLAAGSGSSKPASQLKVHSSPTFLPPSVRHAGSGVICVPVVSTNAEQVFTARIN